MAEWKSTGSCVWTGTLREGSGLASVASGLFTDGLMTFGARFEGAKGTRPEELIAAAHASCFNMALSSGLTKGGAAPVELRTTATVTLRTGDAGAKITAVHLDVTGTVQGLDEPAFLAAATEAKENCPVSRLLKPGLESLTLAARLAT